MKINSNTVKLENEAYKEIESLIKRIASNNKISNVESVQIKLSKTNGIIKFKTAEENVDVVSRELAC